MSSNVTVLGGGNTAFALAADLTLAGHSVRLAELPAMQDTIEPIRESKTIALNGVGHTGEAHLADVTTDIAGAVDGADLVLLSVPAYAHRPFAEACAPHLKAGQLLVLAPGTLGSLEFAQVFEEMGNREEVVLAEVDTSPYVCRKTGPDTAHIWGVVPRLGVGVPAGQPDGAGPRVDVAFVPRHHHLSRRSGLRFQQHEPDHAPGRYPDERGPGRVLGRRLLLLQGGASLRGLPV